MAKRPVFIPDQDSYPPVREELVEFRWHPGFSASQKKKSVAELHNSAYQKGISPVLEVSTKSEDKLGLKLSSFNLYISVKNIGTVPLESAYQGSKVFESGGPYVDIYSKSPKDAKRDERLRKSGKMVGFRFEEVNWELEPKTAFYDWLYLQAFSKSDLPTDQILSYAAFTDIEFNPAKSINSQAHSCAIISSLLKKDLLFEVVKDKSLFLSIMQVRGDEFNRIKQGTLF